MNRIKSLRLEAKITQQDLAKALNVHQTAVSQWETGRTNPDMSVVTMLADHFNISTDYLLGKTDTYNQSSPETKKEPTHEELTQSNEIINLAKRIMALSQEAQDKALDYLSLLEK